MSPAAVGRQEPLHEQKSVAAPAFLLFALIKSNIQKDIQNYTITRQSSSPIFPMAIHPFPLQARFVNNWFVITLGNSHVQCDYTVAYTIAPFCIACKSLSANHDPTNIHKKEDL